jgi:hypothetical protein
MCIVPSFSFGIMRISPAGSFISAASIRMSVFGFFVLRPLYNSLVLFHSQGPYRFVILFSLYQRDIRSNSIITPVSVTDAHDESIVQNPLAPWLF